MKTFLRSIVLSFVLISTCAMAQLMPLANGTRYQGSSSGITTLVPNATASGTLTLPSATDTLVGKATTDNLTNKTLTSAIISGMGGKSGNAVFSTAGQFLISPNYDVSSYGIIGNGSTDNSASMTTLLNAISAVGKGGHINFPCGIFNFSTSIAVTIATNSNITIDGQGCSRLVFGNTDGIVLTYTDNSSWGIVRNVELVTTAATGTNSAIWLKSSVVNTPQNARSSVVEHVHINGSDGFGLTNYWGNGVFQDKVSFLNVNDLTFNGSGTLQGAGISAKGDATNSQFNVVTNVLNSNFAYCQTGFSYGTYYQGLTFVGSNITGCNRGIYSPSGNTLNLQASISSSQFNNGTSNIEFASEMAGVQITGNTFLLHGYGIKTAGLVNSSIVGNSFSAAVTSGQGDGITIGTSGNAAENVSIVGNTCLSINSCINLASGAKGIATANSWWNVTSPFQNLATTTFFQSNNVANGARVTSQAGPLSGVSYADSVTVNNILGSKTSPTISSGFCTSPSIIVPNGTWSFRISVGSSCATGVGVVTMPTANNGWSCTAVSGTKISTDNPGVDLSGSTSTTITVRNYGRVSGLATNFSSGDVINVNCSGQ